MVCFKTLALALGLGLLLEVLPTVASPHVARRELTNRSSCPMATSHLENAVQPKSDPWYLTTPADLDAATPGTIFRARPAPGNLASRVANSSAAYNILFRTTDSQQTATYAVATVFLPQKPLADTTLLSIQLAYDTVDLNQSPSYVMYSYSADQLSDITWALGRGWVVITGDYEGPLASFGAGRMSGSAVLDGVRAVLSSSCGAEFGMPADPGKVRYALWGYSGGGLATEAATELQLKYAPELKFLGAAMGGLTPNATSVIATVNKGLYAAIIPGYLIGSTSQFPDARAYLLSRLKPYGLQSKDLFMSMVETGTEIGIITFAFQDMSSYFIGGFADLDAPIMQRVRESDGQMGTHGVPQMQVFCYKAIHDELSPVADTDALINKYCKMGANILYQRDTVNNHFDEFNSGQPRARSWLIGVLEQGHVQVGCTIQNVTDPYYVFHL
ncbi:uncharacterized protein E0L32_012227 [Thyridium curvatum]|uniref:Triacylglycerol lipase n=1 Tax=Thyridium curvatum TaxID=1093900 RepID=A0A507BIP8_9PEZI|nr:uncharacterized protein E0L32_012227 [Thyridium curvatum]TPX17289.1 hypothetical protein E0L32_012227 [Thyridium curvatum]